MLAPRSLAASALVAFGMVTPALAQPPVPRFQFEKRPAKPADWKVQARGGLLVTTGNSRSSNGNFGLTGSRQSGENKLSLEAMLAYGQSSLLTPVLDANQQVAGFERTSETTTNQWRARGRYDRFFTSNNAAYLLGQIGADRIAGKELFGGGQVGYSRQVWKDDRHTAVVELGYDFSHERYVDQPGRAVDPVSIHSARLFLGELLKLTEDTGLSASVEALVNLNQENAPDASDPTGATTEVAAFEDPRVTGQASLTTTLYKNLSFAFSFTLRYDGNPAPRPLPASAKGAPYAPAFHPFADRVDTLTEATLVFTFL